MATQELSADLIREIERTPAEQLRYRIEEWTTANGRKWVLGGPRNWSKDELVQAVCRIERGPPRKAYYVAVNGKVTRTFLLYAYSVREAREIMDGDRSEAEACGDEFEETGVSRPRRAPGEDRP